MNRLFTLVAATLCLAAPATAQHCADGLCYLTPAGSTDTYRLSTNRGVRYDPQQPGCYGHVGAAPVHQESTVGMCKCDEYGCDCSGHGGLGQPFFADDVPPHNMPKLDMPEDFSRPPVPPLPPVPPVQPTFEPARFERIHPRNPIPTSFRRPATIQWQTSFRDGTELARRSGRNMLLRVTAEWCGHCQRMKRETYAHTGIIRDVDSRFVAVDLDADSNRELVRQLGVTSLPATIVMTPDHRIVAHEQGFRSAAQLSQFLRPFAGGAQLQHQNSITSR